MSTCDPYETTILASSMHLPALLGNEKEQTRCKDTEHLKKFLMHAESIASYQHFYLPTLNCKFVERFASDHVRQIKHVTE